MPRMSLSATHHCLNLLAEIDEVLTESGEGLLSARLSAVTEPLREHASGLQLLGQRTADDN